ncbi:hypothetical protein Ccrd_021862 [Cynara cardunculus var. scolymus]|uniref:AB hydrolase-1 domain-containing protein n=1 Tax=Cynara cardunculus var. scolymus TaxID=59895 RepID=A0A118JZP4_CYNCS|nr:hypothetical protein Ccrd_021862 [Cynara cardunculus var. scolymus]
MKTTTMAAPTISAAAATSHTRKPNSDSSSRFPSGMLKKLLLVFFTGFLAWAYQSALAPPPKTVGSPDGLPVTSPRIKLRDGRHLSYKEYGVPKELAKYKIVFVHGFDSVKYYAALIEDLGIYIVSFDRPGYGESDPDPNRTLKSLALDIEELADQLGLGSKFYVFVQDQWTLRVAHYLPWLTYWWNTQKLFPSLTIIAHSPLVLSRQDRELIPKFTAGREAVQGQVRQQGEYESLHRDLNIGFGTWEFDPVEIENPFPNNEGSIHVWNGDEDLLVPVTLQRYVVQQLPWIRYHELKGAGHMFPYADGISDAILKTLLLGTK